MSARKHPRPRRVGPAGFDSLTTDLHTPDVVHIKGKNVLLAERYSKAWARVVERDPEEAIQLMRHALYRAIGPLDEPNVREAVACAGLYMVDTLKRGRRPGMPEDNLDQLEEFFGQVAEGEEMEIDLVGSAGAVAHLQLRQGARTMTQQQALRLAGASWRLRLGPDTDSPNIDEDFAIIGGHELLRWMEDWMAPYKLGRCTWRDMCRAWRLAFDRLMYRTLIDPTCPAELRRGFATSLMALILALPDGPDEAGDAEDVSDVVPSRQVLDWWREAAGCLAVGSTLSATLAQDDGCLLDLRFGAGVRAEASSELGDLPEMIVTTFGRVAECTTGWPGLPREFRPPRAARRATKIGRNAPCPCGSGKKYKRCCGADG